MISSSLGISRWKDMNQINGCGVRAASRYPQLVYWNYNWRKGGGSQRMIEISKREQFYQQEYCGCVYSLRDTNAHRAAQIPASPVEFAPSLITGEARRRACCRAP
jgi:predicted adenine nucleotide alpha hydrolase (AANH) superfamily ATPase